MRHALCVVYSAQVPGNSYFRACKCFDTKQGLYASNGSSNLNLFPEKLVFRRFVFERRWLEDIYVTKRQAICYIACQTRLPERSRKMPQNRFCAKIICAERNFFPHLPLAIKQKKRKILHSLFRLWVLLLLSFSSAGKENEQPGSSVLCGKDLPKKLWHREEETKIYAFIKVFFFYL